jgi:peptidyl-prolyl cis-trans isomerase SurA
MEAMWKKTFWMAALWFLLAGLAPSAGAVVDRVVAVVNKDFITLSDLEKWAGPLPEELETSDRVERQWRVIEARRRVLDQLIEEKLIDQEARRLGIKVGAKDVDATIEEIKKRNVISQEDLEKALARDGFTLSSYRKQIESKMLRVRLINMAVKMEPKMSEKDLRDFYQKNQDRYRTTESYRPGHILCAVAPDAPPEDVREARSKCQGLLDRAQKGEDFGELAVLFSEDVSARSRGDLGIFKQGELVPNIEREVLKLQVGEVGGLLRTEFGFHVLKLLERKGGEPPPFEEVQDRVRAEFLEAEIEKALKQYMTTLRQKSVVEIKL